MIAMRNTQTMLYDQNPKRGQCEPKFDMPDEGRLTNLSTTMTRQVQTALKKDRKSVQIGNVYKGPHIAGYARDK